MVKPRAFLPVDRETSVFRTQDVSEQEVWQMAVVKVEPTRGKCRARGDFPAAVVFGIGLGVLPDNELERHAVINGWPTEKDEQLTLAQELAASATLAVRQ